MYIRFILLVLNLVFVLPNINMAQESHSTNLQSAYLGQKPPGMTPEVFAPGIVLI